MKKQQKTKLAYLRKDYFRRILITSGVCFTLFTHNSKCLIIFSLCSSQHHRRSHPKNTNWLISIAKDFWRTQTDQNDSNENVQQQEKTKSHFPMNVQTRTKTSDLELYIKSIPAHNRHKLAWKLPSLPCKTIHTVTPIWIHTTLIKAIRTFVMTFASTAEDLCDGKSALHFESQ